MRGLAIAIVLFLFASHAFASERAILVLGSTVARNGQPTPGLARRLALAQKLATKDPRAVLIVSGGTRGGKWPAEGPAMARWLAAHGVAPSRIRVEDRATNTAENADYATPILLSEGVHHVTVVTERFHLARGLFHVRSALATAGAQIDVDGAGAPDGLRGAVRAQRDREEAAKLERDRAFRAAR